MWQIDIIIALAANYILLNNGKILIDLLCLMHILCFLSNKPTREQVKNVENNDKIVKIFVSYMILSIHITYLFIFLCMIALAPFPIQSIRYRLNTSTPKKLSSSVP